MGTSRFNGQVVFQIGGGFIFKWGGGGGPWGASVLMGGGVLKKIVGLGGVPPCPPTMGNHATWKLYILPRSVSYSQ